MARKSSEGSDLLKEIRENFRYYEEAWHDIREEARLDMQYVAGDPWDPKERSLREENDRPCITWDEINPYINKLVNDPKQNKRSVQVSPKGGGANDQTAELRGNIIREIEYNSKAQMAFTTAFQGAAERSYGYVRVGKRYVASVGTDANTDSFNQELYIGRIPNPDSVLFDPMFKEIDASDAMGCFVIDRMRKEDFKRDYPGAEKTDFTSEDMEVAPQWIYDKEIQVCEYWRVTIEKKPLYLFKGGEEGATAYYEDELPDGFDISRAADKREIGQRKVTQYITNGVEILDETEIEIPFIPIVPCFGKEIWINEGGGAKRMLISLVRMARDPFMSYCFLRSQEMEESGMTPKAPFMVYKGQVNPADKEAWQTVNKVARAYLEVEPVMDATGQTVLPLPSRPAFSPNFQAYEIACEAARRAIQTAMSGSVLPTQAQRMNEKSGVALKEIDAQEDAGTFHFIDNYNHFIEQVGRIEDAWIPYVYDTQRDIGIRKADGTHKTVTINNPNGVDEQGQPQPNDTKTGEHGVTIAVGPSEDSQREIASQFVETLVTNLKTLPLGPQQAQQILALAIRLKPELGPIGREMADVISPPDQQSAQQLQQAQQQLQQQGEVMQKMQAELQKLQLEKAGKVIQGETEKQIQQMQNDIKVLVALIQAKTQNAEQEQEMFKQFWLENHGAAHETALQKDQQEHEKTLASQQQAHEAAQGAAGAAAGSAQSAQEHGQNLEQQAAEPQPQGENQ